MKDEFDLESIDKLDEIGIEGISIDTESRDVMKVTPVTLSKGLLADFKDTSITQQAAEIAAGTFNSLNGIIPDREILEPISEIKKTVKEVKSRTAEQVTSIYEDLQGLTGIKIPILDKIGASLYSNDTAPIAEQVKDGATIAEETLAGNATQYASLSAVLANAKATSNGVKISKAILDLNTYSQSINESYYRKAIELKYNHLLESKKHTRLLSTLLDSNQNDLKVIGHNTSLPDALKIRGPEALALQARQEFFKSQLHKPFSENGWGTSAVANVKQFKNNFGTLLANKLGPVAEMLGVANQGKESLAMMNDPDMLEMTGRNRGESLGGMLGGVLRGTAGKLLGNTIGRTKVGKNALNAMANASIDYNTYFENMENSDSKIKSTVGGILAKLGKRKIDSEASLNITKIKDPFAPAELNNRTLETINKVIPTLLSKILVQTTKINTGKDSEELRYNALTGKFTTDSGFQRTYQETVQNRAKASGVDTKLAGLINTLQSLSGVALSTKEIKKLSHRIIKARSDRDPSKRLTFMGLTNSSFYKDSSEKVRKLLLFATTDPRTRIIKTSVVKQLQGHLTKIGLDDGIHTINALSDLGFTDSLENLKQIEKQQDGSYVLKNNGDDIRKQTAAAITRSASKIATKNRTDDSGIDSDILNKHYDKATDSINKYANTVLRKDYLKDNEDIEIRGMADGVEARLYKYNWKKHKLTESELKELNEQLLLHKNAKSIGFYTELASKYKPSLLKQSRLNKYSSILKYKASNVTGTRIGMDGFRPYLHNPNKSKSYSYLTDALGVNVGDKGDTRYSVDLSTDKNIVRDSQGRVLRNGERYNIKVEQTLRKINTIKGSSATAATKDREIDKVLTALGKDDPALVREAIDRMRAEGKSSSTKGGAGDTGSANTSNPTGKVVNDIFQNSTTSESYSTGQSTYEGKGPNPYRTQKAFDALLKKFIKKFDVYDFINLPKGTQFRLMETLGKLEYISKRNLEKFKKAVNNYNKVQDKIEGKRTRIQARDKLIESVKELEGKDLRKFNREEFFADSSNTLVGEFLEAQGYKVNNRNIAGRAMGRTKGFFEDIVKKKKVMFGEIEYNDYMQDKIITKEARERGYMKGSDNATFMAENVTGRLDNRTLYGKAKNVLKDFSMMEGLNKFMVNKKAGVSNTLSDILGMDRTIGASFRDHMDTNYSTLLKGYDVTKGFVSPYLEKGKDLLGKGYDKVKKFLSPYAIKLRSAAKDYVSKFKETLTLKPLKDMALRAPDLVEAIILRAISIGMISKTYGIKLAELLDKYRRKHLTDEEFLTPAEGFSAESVRAEGEIADNVREQGEDNKTVKAIKEMFSNKYRKIVDDVTGTVNDPSSAIGKMVDGVKNKFKKKEDPEAKAVKQYRRYHSAINSGADYETSMKRLRTLMLNNKIDKDGFEMLEKELDRNKDKKDKPKTGWRSVLDKTKKTGLNARDTLTGRANDVRGKTGPIGAIGNWIKDNPFKAGAIPLVGAAGFIGNEIMKMFNDPDRENENSALKTMFYSALKGIAPDFVMDLIPNPDRDKAKKEKRLASDVYKNSAKQWVNVFNNLKKEMVAGKLGFKLEPKVLEYWNREGLKLWTNGEFKKAIQFGRIAESSYNNEKNKGIGGTISDTFSPFKPTAKKSDFLDTVYGNDKAILSKVRELNGGLADRSIPDSELGIFDRFKREYNKTADYYTDDDKYKFNEVTLLSAKTEETIAEKLNRGMDTFIGAGNAIMSAATSIVSTMGLISKVAFGNGTREETTAANKALISAAVPDMIGDSIIGDTLAENTSIYGTAAGIGIGATASAAGVLYGGMKLTGATGRGVYNTAVAPIKGTKNIIANGFSGLVDGYKNTKGGKGAKLLGGIIGTYKGAIKSPKDAVDTVKSFATGTVSAVKDAKGVLGTTGAIFRGGVKEVTEMNLVKKALHLNKKDAIEKLEGLRLMKIREYVSAGKSGKEAAALADKDIVKLTKDMSANKFTSARQVKDGDVPSSSSKSSSDIAKDTVGNTKSKRDLYGTAEDIVDDTSKTSKLKGAYDSSKDIFNKAKDGVKSASSSTYNKIKDTATSDKMKKSIDAGKGKFSSAMSYISKGAAKVPLSSKIATAMLPGAAAGLLAYDAYDSFKNGDYWDAALSAGLGLASLHPVGARIAMGVGVAQLTYSIYDMFFSDSKKLNEEIVETTAKASAETQKASLESQLLIKGVTETIVDDTVSMSEKIKNKAAEYADKASSTISNKFNEVEQMISKSTTVSPWKVDTTSSDTTKVGNVNDPDTIVTDTTDKADKVLTTTPFKPQSVRSSINTNFKPMKIQGTKANVPGINSADKILLEAIARFESALGIKGYNVTYGNGKYNGVYGRNLTLTNKTINEIYMIQAELRKQSRLDKGAVPSSAISKYQFIESTLVETVKSAKISTNTLFTPEVQDMLILDRLVKFRKYHKWINGDISDKVFLRNLAQEFASIANPFKGVAVGHYGNQAHAANTTTIMYPVLKKVKAMYMSGEQIKPITYDEVNKILYSSQADSSYGMNEQPASNGSAGFTKDLFGNVSSGVKGGLTTALNSAVGMIDDILGVDAMSLFGGTTSTDNGNTGKVVTPSNTDIIGPVKPTVVEPKVEAETVKPKTVVDTPKEEKVITAKVEGVDITNVHLSSIVTSMEEQNKLISTLINKDTVVNVAVEPTPVTVQQVEVVKPLRPIIEHVR